MGRASCVAGIAVGLGALAFAGAAAAGPAVEPPPAREFKDGRWQARVKADDDGRKAYWFAAGMSLAFGAGRAPAIIARQLRRAGPAAGVGAGLGAAVGTAVVFVIGRPDGTPPIVGPAMVGVYTAVGAVAGWKSAREPAPTSAAPPPAG
jgi:hypothetical protein